MSQETKKVKGIITKSIGGSYTVEAPEGLITCKPRGVFRNKGITPVCGDSAEVLVETDGSGVIVEIGERKNVLSRPPVANADILLIVASTCEPEPNYLIIDKFIAVAEYKSIEPVLVLTKSDLNSADDAERIYKNAGISVFVIDNTTKEGCDELKKHITGKLSVLAGNTGVGKSSLLNNLFSELCVKTGEISKKLGRGRHTTRHAELYKFDEGGYIADTPGFSSLDVGEYDIILKKDIAGCFREFAQYTGKCKFHDCAHIAEKGCAVREAVERGEISPSRMASYVQMYKDASEIQEWKIKKNVK